MSEKSAGRKAIESYKKHEDLIDNAVRLGKAAGLDVDATVGNDPKGDVRVAVKDKDRFLELLSNTIDSNRAKGSN
jgi:hypothetical protein